MEHEFIVVLPTTAFQVRFPGRSSLAKRFQHRDIKVYCEDKTEDLPIEHPQVNVIYRKHLKSKWIENRLRALEAASAAIGLGREIKKNNFGR
jgi:hypothetical protein